MKKILFVALFGLCLFEGIAQQEFHIGVQTDIGVATAPKFGNDMLKHKLISPHFGGLMSLSYRLKDAIGFEVGVGQHWNNTRLKDPTFEKENEGFKVKLNNKNYYWNYYGALTGFFRIGISRNYIYTKLGYSFNVLGGETLTQSQPFEITQSSTNKTVSASTVYSQTNHSFIPEVGFQRKASNRHLFSVGLKMNIGTDNTFKSTYTIQDNLSGNTTTNDISSFGNLLALTVKYDLLLYYKGPRGRKKKETEQGPLIVDKPKRKNAKRIDDRKMVVEHRIKVSSPKVQILLWDHKLVDGDKVSLNLNGNWILEKYTLKREQYKLEIELKEGVNLLGLHALNLGKHGLNTAAMIVNDGVKEKQLILRSDMKKTGTLEINYIKPVE